MNSYLLYRCRRCGETFQKNPFWPQETAAAARLHLERACQHPGETWRHTVHHCRNHTKGETAYGLADLIGGSDPIK